jgi:hypothetical protein
MDFAEDHAGGAKSRKEGSESVREMRHLNGDGRRSDLIETLRLCDAPQEVIEKLRATISEYVKEGNDRFSISVGVKVYKPPRGMNKMVFRAVADEFVQGATLYKIWSFVHRYYSRTSKFDKSLEYKGWETYVSREVLKLVEMGYAHASDLEALRELVRTRKRLKRFREMWNATSKKITVKPVISKIRKLPSRPSKKKLEVEIFEGKAVVHGLCGKSLVVDL